MTDTQCEAHKLRLAYLETVINGNGSDGMKASLVATRTEGHALKEEVREVKLDVQDIAHKIDKVMYGIIGLGATFVLNVCATLLAAFLLTRGG